MRKTTKRQPKSQMYTLCQATDKFCDRHANVFAVKTTEYGGVAVQEGGGWYWVYRVGQYNCNERYQTPGQILRAIGAGENDRPVWALDTMA